MRVRIKEIHESDAFYENADELIGKTGEMTEQYEWEYSLSDNLKGWTTAYFKADEPVTNKDGSPFSNFCFVGIKYEVLNESKN
jgi:hypothetical protein